MTKDLTEGKPLQLILQFALPTLVGILFQQFYAMVDTMIVGNLLDTKALAAVGSTGSLNFMVIGFVLGLSNGFAIPVAQQMGAGNESIMRKYVANAFWLTGLFSVVLTFVTTLFCQEILILMKTPEEIIQGAYAYIFVMFCGIPAIFLYNLLACVIRALGDSKTPVYFLALASLMNIVLDYVLIAYTPMGVGGAALATVVSQGFSALCCLLYIKKKFPILKMTALEKKLDLQACKHLCYIGVPMGLQTSITATGNVIMQTAVNDLGSAAVGAISTSNKLSIFFWAPFDALGQTMATYCGQNVGAVKLERLGQGIKSACLMGLAYGVFAYGAMRLLAEPLLMLFVNPEEEAIEQFLLYGEQNLMIINSFMSLLCILLITRFSIQGMGFSNLAMIAGVLEMTARIYFAYFVVPTHGFAAVCYSVGAAWIAAVAFLVPATFGCIKHLKKTLAPVAIGVD